VKEYGVGNDMEYYWKTQSDDIDDDVFTAQQNNTTDYTFVTGSVQSLQFQAEVTIHNRFFI
jgi:hypothetical protein